MFCIGSLDASFVENNKDDILGCLISGYVAYLLAFVLSSGFYMGGFEKNKIGNISTILLALAAGRYHLFVIRACRNRYTHRFTWDIITYPYTNHNGTKVKGRDKHFANLMNRWSHAHHLQPSLVRISSRGVDNRRNGGARRQIWQSSGLRLRKHPAG